MSFNVADSSKELFTNELVNKIAAFLGESESGITKAINVIIPTFISGLVDKCSTHPGASSVAYLAMDAHNAGFTNDVSLFSGNESNGFIGKGTSMVSTLFGENKMTKFASAVANFSTIKTNSAGTLLSLAAPLILGQLGKYVSTKNLSVSGLASLLNNQKESAFQAIPEDENLRSIFNSEATLHQNGLPITNGISTKYVAKEEAEIAVNGMKWLLPLFLLMVIALFAWYLMGKGCHGSKNLISDMNDSLKSGTEQVGQDLKNSLGAVDSLTGEYIYNLGKTITIDLPNNGGKIEVGENSTESKLYKFLMDKNAMIDTAKGNWFEFTNVHFKTGGTQLDSSSTMQLKNIEEIMKAFPTATFKVGGYTDNTGDSISNVVLSQKRADVVVTELNKLGTTSTSISGAKGYGPQWPIADNATKEGRAMNRRVALNVKSK